MWCNEKEGFVFKHLQRVGDQSPISLEQFGSHPGLGEHLLHRFFQKIKNLENETNTKTIEGGSEYCGRTIFNKYLRISWITFENRSGSKWRNDHAAHSHSKRSPRTAMKKQMKDYFEQFMSNHLHFKKHQKTTSCYCSSEKEQGFLHTKYLIRSTLDPSGTE